MAGGGEEAPVCVQMSCRVPGLCILEDAQGFRRAQWFRADRGSICPSCRGPAHVTLSGPGGRVPSASFRLPCFCRRPRTAIHFWGPVENHLVFQSIEPHSQEWQRLAALTGVPVTPTGPCAYQTSKPFHSWVKRAPRSPPLLFVPETAVVHAPTPSSEIAPDTGARRGCRRGDGPTPPPVGVRSWAGAPTPASSLATGVTAAPRCSGRHEGGQPTRCVSLGRIRFTARRTKAQSFAVSLSPRVLTRGHCERAGWRASWGSHSQAHCWEDQGPSEWLGHLGGLFMFACGCLSPLVF